MKQLFVSHKDDTKNRGSLFRHPVDFRDKFFRMPVALCIYLTLPLSGPGGDKCVQYSVNLSKVNSLTL